MITKRTKLFRKFIINRFVDYRENTSEEIVFSCACGQVIRIDSAWNDNWSHIHLDQIYHSFRVDSAFRNLFRTKPEMAVMESFFFYEKCI